MNKIPRELTEDEKEVLKPDMRSFVVERMTHAKEVFHKAEAEIENIVRQAVKVFSPVEPLQKIVDNLEERTEKLTKEVEILLAAMEKNKSTQPPLSQ